MNRIIMITGANNGIGLAMSQSLLEMGDCVAALDLSQDNLDQTRPNLLPFRGDVTDPQQIQTVVDEVVRIWNGIDILINNACLALFKPFVERTIDDIRREFEVNYFGYLNMISAVLPIMRKQKRGVIHNVSSGVGFTGMPGLTGYTSTKGAIESLTRTLALELVDEGITVNVIHPPLTRTKSASGFGVPADGKAALQHGEAGRKSPRRNDMNTKTEGTLAISAALLVLFSAMWDPRVSVAVSMVAFLGFGIFKYLQKDQPS